VKAMPSRVERPGHARPRLGRAAAALVLTTGLLLGSAGCGMDAQTLKPYTPGEGINLDIGDPAKPNQVVHVRNLLVISKTEGTGVISATMVTNDRDQLTALSGAPIKVDGSQGAPFTAKLPNTVALANRAQVVLTSGQPITVTSPDIVPGLTATLTLAFKNPGTVSTTVPVADGNEGQYTSITPVPATPAPTP